MMFLHLLELTENDKRILIAILLFFFLFFAIVGWIVQGIRKIMHIQGKVVDTYMDDMTKTNVIKSKRRFTKIARYKSRYLLFKQAWIPLLIMAVAWIIVAVYVTISHEDNLLFLFSEKDGFGTLFFIQDWSKAPRADFFGLHIISGWAPLKEIVIDDTIVQCHPRAYWSSGNWWISIITVPMMIVSALWFLLITQRFIARDQRIYYLSRILYQKNLEVYAEDPEVKNNTKDKKE
ncbi:MAG: hypothetical protein HUJ61_03935 [Bacilli bacterium]|nr:hypothetical protein [Bacilli bacterium]